jgi:hypothetical protein
VTWQASKSGSTTTKHTHAVVFGRREDGCPRCAELDAGAAPVVQSWRKRESDDARLSREIREHQCGTSCGAVCTFGQW